MPHSYEVCLSFFYCKIMHCHLLVPLPDVTARRNTIANALELVKVTKGKVGAYGYLSTPGFVLALSGSIFDTEYHCLQSGGKGMSFIDATRLCILFQCRVFAQVFDIRAPEDVINLYPPHNDLRPHNVVSPYPQALNFQFLAYKIMNMQRILILPFN